MLVELNVMLADLQDIPITVSVLVKTAVDSAPTESEALLWATRNTAHMTNILSLNLHNFPIRCTHHIYPPGITG